MSKATNSKKFHGMEVVSDFDTTSVKGNYVIEVNSNNNLVCRYYDENGLADDNPMILDYVIMPNCTESNVTWYLKRQIGLNSVLISDSAISLIQDYVKSASI